jgi:hypothetical protein
MKFHSSRCRRNQQQQGKLSRESLEGNNNTGEVRVLLPRTFTEISFIGGVLRGNVGGPELGWSRFCYVGGAEPPGASFRAERRNGFDGSV